MEADKSVLTIKIENTRPIDLMALGLSFAAFSEEFCDFADGAPADMRLYVQEIRAGSVIAHLTVLSEQIDWLSKNAEICAAFVSSFNDLVNFFLGKPHNLKEDPTPKQAKNIMKIVEPTARDHGSQFNINATDGATVNIINIGSIDANAIQNNVSRFLGSHPLPSTQILVDQLMQLEQVKNDAKKKGDRGIITDISDKPVNLVFASDDAKRAVLELEENPFKCLFLVDLEVKFHEDKPKAYKIYTVKSVIRD